MAARGEAKKLINLRYSRSAQGKARKRRYQQNHREKYLAQVAVRNAVARAILSKPDRCEACSRVIARERLHAHHADYSKPLDIRWLCNDCHRIEHGFKRQPCVAGMMGDEPKRPHT
jgi:hypothetical protein